MTMEEEMVVDTSVNNIVWESWASHVGFRLHLLKKNVANLWLKNEICSESELTERTIYSRPQASEIETTFATMRHFGRHDEI